MFHSFSSEAGYSLFHQLFLYCPCQYARLGFISLFENSQVPVHIIPVESPDDITQYNDMPGGKLLVITGHDDSLWYCEKAARFEWCWKQNASAARIMCVHMYSGRHFSYRNADPDFPLCGTVRQIRQDIIMLLNEISPRDVPVRQSVILTPREKALMHCMSEGLSLRDIAGRMGMSEKTVQVVRMAIIKKMGLKNRNHLHRIKFIAQ